MIFAVLAMLWHRGPRTLYFAMLDRLGFVPFRFPFLDIHAVLAAVQCHRLGIDVYRFDPCDVLGRVHVYSPLWLAIVPHVLDTSATTAVGLGLDLIFILSLAFVIRPTGPGEALLCGLIALSPMTVYALERANCDLVIFLLVVAGCVLARMARPWRFGAYAIFLFAGLLKYYPLVLLALIVRERRRDALILAGFAALILVGLAGFDHTQLRKALANIPAFSYFSDSFSARNLPFGLADNLFGPRLRGAAGLLLLALLAIVAAGRARRTARLLDVSVLNLGSLEEECLLAGALLMTACFFAGQNVDYRGIFFVLIMPGLIRLYRLAEGPPVRRFLAQMIVAVLFVAWEAPVRAAVHRLAVAIFTGGIGLRIDLLFWLGRELLWWWLIAGLAAIILAFAARWPLRSSCRWPRLDMAVPAAIPRAKRSA
ncbi:MAG TPA: glycosyltransferase 87 family protein [Stellaceae bacterium]|nr:glycosyltransferase 87 family protein [Stellaceae bacterium]